VADGCANDDGDSEEKQVVLSRLALPLVLVERGGVVFCFYSSVVASSLDYPHGFGMAVYGGGTAVFCGAGVAARNRA